MQNMLEPEQAQFMDALISRLKLAIGGLEDNAFVAQSDLEVLADGLMQLEETAFMGSE
ncbi:MAG: hypothetical protein HC806_03570 [Anaerolineae bacterium]|nr:hypothetical protein [Anaerolineae bacterium]